MKREAKQTLTNAKATPPDISFLANPLDFIAEVYLRERELCALIDKMASNSRPDEDDCGQVLAFLKHHLLQHLEDEDNDLFPMMLERCEPEDEIQKVIDKLQSDHRHARSDTPELIALLEDKDVLSAGFSDEARVQMIEFATRARRHLVLENAIILPIARARLTKKDLEIMKEHMLERRDLNLSREGS